MSRARDPIFVLGVYPRCGTNHLVNLLCAHPDCAAPAPVWEDHLLAHADHLVRYVAAVSARWDPAWGTLPVDELFASLGRGLQGFLQDRVGDRRVVTKTPRVDHLPLFPRLFPRASLLVLVRDGRAVVESGVRSFGWFRDGAIHGWAEAAETVASFDAAEHGGPLRYRIVRYEDLVAEPEAELRRLLDFLELDPARYDFAKALDLPVLGSSDLRRRRGDRVHWDPVPHTEEFDPLHRFAHWSRWRHSRFNRVAGAALRRLGYAPAPSGLDPRVESPWNRLLDLRTRAVGPLRALRAAWRRRRERSS